MIDIHCHILPGIDDGAEDLEESLRMARMAADEGIDAIIATPHHRNREWQNPKDEILERVDSLNEAIREAGIPLTVLPGQETRIFGEMVEAYADDELLTLNNKDQYIFVEFSFKHVPGYAERLLYDLQVAGLTPVIVHPERNSAIVENPDILYNFVNNGALSQVTAASVAGVFGKKLKKFSLDLADNGLTHFVASDAHNTTQRPFLMQAALSELDARFGAGMRYLFDENSRLLADGDAINKDAPQKLKTKKFLGLF